MKFGDIVLVPFPFAELTKIKIRPAVVIAITSDKYKDVIVAAVSSVVPQKLSANEILLSPDASNNLRAKSVLKVDRLVTLKKENIVSVLGKLKRKNSTRLKTVFVNLVN